MRTDYFRHLKGAVTFVTSTQNSHVTTRQEEKSNENNARVTLSRLSRLSREKTSESVNCHVSRLHSSGVDLPKNNHTICNDNSDTQSSKLARRYFETLPKNSRDKRDTRDKEKNTNYNNSLMPLVSVTLPENSHVTNVTNLLEALEGLPLLPDDRKFIKRRLLLLPVTQRENALLEYRQRFVAGMEAEPLTHRKENAGRYRANTWLLEATERHPKVSRGNSVAASTV